MRRCLVAAGALAALGLGGGSSGCSASGDQSTVGNDAPHETRTTRVQVVGGLGRRGGLDAAALYDRLSPGVVTVISRFGDSDSLGSDNGEGGQGSGFALDGDGYVATNAHVVTNGPPPDTEKADQVYVELFDGNRVPGRVVGYDLNSDVALLKIDPAGLRLTPLRLGHSEDLTVGAPVAAIGSPFGERQSLSVGVISALDRSIESLTEFQIGNAIQTDAAINPGNSGGPLLNARGQVLGINSQIKSTSGGGEGVGFAIPVDTVRRSLADLRRTGEVKPGYLGVTSQPLYPQLARRLGLPVSAGALVVEVQSDSPAAEAGLEKGGDTIAFQGQRGIPSEGDVSVGCVVEIPSGQIFLAARGQGLLEGPPVVLSPNERIDRMFWTYGFRGRPARALTEVLAELLDGSSVGGGTFDLGSAAFDMTRVVTGQIDAYVEPGPRMVDDVPGVREQFERVGGGAVLNNSPYDLAGAALVCREAGAIVTDAYGRSLEDRPLLGSGADYQMSVVCTANRALHESILREVDAGVGRLAGRIDSRRE